MNDDVAEVNGSDPQCYQSLSSMKKSLGSRLLDSPTYLQSMYPSTHTHTHTQSTRVIDPDEELAHLLSDGKLMLSQDEELARQLQEEENQRAKQVSGLQHEEEKTSLDQDHQLALQLQKEQLVSSVQKIPFLLELGTFES